MENNLTEQFRKALMERHADDWSMEVISEAAHICTEQSEAYTTNKIIEELERLDKKYYRPEEYLNEARENLAKGLFGRIEELKALNHRKDKDE